MSLISTAESRWETGSDYTRYEPSKYINGFFERAHRTFTSKFITEKIKNNFPSSQTCQANIDELSSSDHWVELYIGTLKQNGWDDDAASLQSAQFAEWIAKDLYDPDMVNDDPDMVNGAMKQKSYSVDASDNYGRKVNDYLRCHLSSIFKEQAGSDISIPAVDWSKLKESEETLCVVTPSFNLDDPTRTLTAQPIIDNTGLSVGSIIYNVIIS